MRRCNEDPAELAAACSAFSALPYSKGFQAGLLTPVLNALRPEDFLLFNFKSRQSINYFTSETYGSYLTDYPAANAAGHELIEEVAEELHSAGALEKIRDSDRFDMFSHWLVAVRKYPFPHTRYWKVAPGRGAWQCDECRGNGFIAVGWNDMGDVSGLSRVEFNARRNKVVAEHDGWTKAGVNQVWTFARINEGDRIVANRGTSEVLGIGTVTGPYRFIPGTPQGHQLPVEWEDTTSRRVSEGGWRKTVIDLDGEKFESIRKAPPMDEAPTPHGGSPFSTATFELLAGLHENSTAAFYQAHREEFKEHLEEPFQRLFGEVAARLPAPITETMETQSKIFSRIGKNDWGKGGAWPFYWGAYYSKGGNRIADAQLLL